jgi:hypothetical protein
VITQEILDKVSFVGDHSEEHASFFESPFHEFDWWDKCKKHFQMCFDNPDLYKLEEFKSWWLVHFIPIWGMHPGYRDQVFNLLKGIIEPFLSEISDDDRWRSALTHERDWYRDVDDITNNVNTGDIGGVKTELTIGMMTMHWVILNQFDIDPKDLDYIFEFGGGVGHIPKLVKKLGFCGKYCIFDLPELSVFQQFYNNFEITVINHPILIDSFLGGRGSNGLFYSTWALSEAPIDLRIKMESRFSSFRYCFILYQHRCMGVDNVEYFGEMCKRNPNFEWTKVNLYGYKIGDNDTGDENTYLVGVNKNYG